jgi:hypothetical protein
MPRPPVKPIQIGGRDVIVYIFSKYNTYRRELSLDMFLAREGFTYKPGGGFALQTLGPIQRGPQVVLSSAVVIRHVITSSKHVLISRVLNLHPVAMLQYQSSGEYRYRLVDCA